MVIKLIDIEFQLILTFLFILMISISENFCYTIDSDFNYPMKLRLNNGNYLVMTGSGIYLFDEEFTSKIVITSFDSNLITKNEMIYSADIAQFLSEDNGYVICLILNETYVISKRGEFLYHFTIDYSKTRVGNQIIPYEHSNNNYSFVIMTLENLVIHIRKYKYDSINNTVNYEGYYHFYTGNAYSYLSCELMNSSSYSKVIFCFYGEWNGIYYVVFETDGFNPIDYYKGKINIGGIEGGQLFVTNINSITRKDVACCTQKYSELNCFGYNIDSNTFTSVGKISEGNCREENIELKIEFFPETEQFLLGCKSKNDTEYFLGTLNSNNEFNIYKIENISAECNGTNLFSFIYSSGKYSILTDSPYCPDKRVVQIPNIEVQQIRDYPSDEVGVTINPNCEGYIAYDTSECYSNIIDGYFYNDTPSNIIYKCHSNCKTCKEEGTDEDNKCLTCKDSKYFDLGNCRDICEHDTFIDSDLIEKCKCTKNISCEYCNEESNNLNLCISCNHDKGYFTKSDDEQIDGFINCYKNPEGYYLDTNIYKPCYSTCKNCSELGDENDNKCIYCKDGFEFKYDFEDDNNCYKICNYYYYYYDSNNKYKCTDNDSCPDDFNKLIEKNKRCVNKCSNYNLYEYDNKCLDNCPNNTHIENNICIEDLNCEIKGKYYNYEKTECIDNITPGYYCNDELLRTIEKCHVNCKTCEQGGTNDDNNCLTCPDTGTKYFDLGNCLESCTNGYFVENSINKCKCSINITCEFCSTESKEYHLCESCNTEKGYFPKNNDENNIDHYINCYNDESISCAHYFYFKSSKYFCTENNICPEEYSYLIKEKKKVY